MSPLRMERPAIAPTAVLPEATAVGALSAKSGPPNSTGDWVLAHPTLVLGPSPHARAAPNKPTRIAFSSSSTRIRPMAASAATPMSGQSIGRVS